VSCAHFNKPADTQGISLDELPEISYLQYRQLSNTFAVDRLHRIKIGEIKSVEDSMESDIALDAEFLFYPLTQAKDITEEERTSIYTRLIMLSVMNEKFNIEQWKQNKNLQKIFTKVQTIDPELTSKFRCFNWEKPMWADRGNCEKPEE
jgi:hypothetical protein